MPGVNEAVLTDRDRVLLSYVGIARYASAQQIHRLVAEGLDKTVVYRRLRKLSARGNRPAGVAYLRRLEYRRPEGLAAQVWTLTGAGRVVAESCVPYLRSPSQGDVGHIFLEHALMLNDVLLGLVLGLRRSELAPLAELPFRWFCEGDEALRFEVVDRALGRTAKTVVKPDAILEVPGRARRLFFEAETGAHSIATADPVRHGPVLRKLERYRRFFAGDAGAAGEQETHYARAFPDRYAPELVFLVHSLGRRGRVETAVREALGVRPPREFGVRILTFAGAPAALVANIGGEAEMGVPRMVAVDGGMARRLRDGYNALAEAFNATRRAVAEHNATCQGGVAVPHTPLAELRSLRDLIQHDLLGEPRPSVRTPEQPLAK